MVLQKAPDLSQTPDGVNDNMHHSHHFFYPKGQPSGIHLICQTLDQMYRRIIGNLPHCTRATHTAVLERFHIDPPLVTFDKLANQAHQSLTAAMQCVLETM